MNEQLSWYELVALEPELGELLAEALSLPAEGDDRFCFARAYQDGHDDRPSFKSRIQRLVGWYRKERHPVLSSVAAYDIVLRTIQDALPACWEGCICYYY